MGESPPLPHPEAYRPTRLADLVVELADCLGLERFDLLGHAPEETIALVGDWLVSQPRVA